MAKNRDNMPHGYEGGQEEMSYSIDDFLGGAVRLKQPIDGYRVSMDTLLLAASVPAQSGDTILDAGTGSAGAALCLAHRVSGVQVTGIELQEEMAGYGASNVALNDMDDRVTILQGDITALPAQFKAGSFDHVMTNPPYMPSGKANRSASQTKGLAHMEQSASLKEWVNFCVDMARHKGSITFVYRADRLDELFSRLYGRVGDLRLCPLWPHKDEAAKLILVQGRKGVSGGMVILPGLVLHNQEEGYTVEAEAILRHGGELIMGTIKPMKSSFESLG